MDVTATVQKIEDERNYLLRKTEQDERVIDIQRLEIASLTQRVRAMNESHHIELQGLRDRLAVAEEKAAAVSATIEAIGRLAFEGIDKARGNTIAFEHRDEEELRASRPVDVGQIEQQGTVFDLAKSIARS